MLAEALPHLGDAVGVIHRRFTLAMRTQWGSRLKEPLT